MSDGNTEILESEGGLLHTRFDHISQNYLGSLRKATYEVKNFIYNKTIDKCATCTQAKMIRNLNEVSVNLIYIRKLKTPKQLLH